jgi:hypothetical protein
LNDRSDARIAIPRVVTPSANTAQSFALQVAFEDRDVGIDDGARGSKVWLVRQGTHEHGPRLHFVEGEAGADLRIQPKGRDDILQD